MAGAAMAVSFKTLVACAGWIALMIALGVEVARKYRQSGAGTLATGRRAVCSDSYRKEQQARLWRAQRAAGVGRVDQERLVLLAHVGRLLRPSRRGTARGLAATHRCSRGAR